MDYYKEKCFKYLGLVQTQQSPATISEDLMYVNNINNIAHMRVREYNAWYRGDTDELLNLYTGNMLYDYNTEPLYYRNRRNFFWSVSATEADIKRTHSGQPRNVVDSLVNIIGLPRITVQDDKNQKLLNEILSDNDFFRKFSQQYLPLALVEGWGCFKIDYDSYLRGTVIIQYYRADEVDFIYKSGQVVAILFKNYYTAENGRTYVLYETRRQERVKDDVGKFHSNLLIEKELFELGRDGNTLTKKNLTDLPQLSDIEPRLMLKDYDGFLAEPFIIFESTDEFSYGRSIFTGKVSLFDDLDQCLSQAANTVRRSTTRVYLNSNYLERDPKTGMPLAPTLYDCKYVLFSGGVGADGSTAGQAPIETVQPKLDFSQYSSQAVDILCEIVSGIMSPAALGIDLAKRNNASDTREKDKVTIYTRNTIIRVCEKVIKKLMKEALRGQELMNRGKIDTHDYDIGVKFSEFANDSFESRVEALLTLYNAQVLTPELFVKELYKDSLSDEEIKAQIKYVKDQKEMQQQNGGIDPQMAAMMGGMMGGNNNNPYNEMMAKPDVTDVYEDQGVPDLEAAGSTDNARK